MYRLNYLSCVIYVLILFNLNAYYFVTKKKVYYFNFDKQQLFIK
jgi:hypothetical protein